MDDNTHLKDLQAKVQTLFTLMDNNEYRFKTIEQSLSSLPLIQQSLTGISQFLEFNQLIKPAGEYFIGPSLIDDSSHAIVYNSMDNYSSRNIKIDFPKFASKEALQWIFQAEQFFEYYGVPDNHLLRITLVHFDGEAVP